jgi:hypothetical protein
VAVRHQLLVELVTQPGVDAGHLDWIVSNAALSVSSRGTAVRAGWVAARPSPFGRTLLARRAPSGQMASPYVREADGPGALKGHPKVGTPSRAARDADTARRLWDLTAGLTVVDAPSGIH